MIKAIDTHYKGCKFRSRLEARVAVMLDHLQASWQYEPEGFYLSDNGKYLPDFLVQSMPGFPKSFWLEVKAQEPTQAEVLKLRELCVATSTPGAFFTGTVPEFGKSERFKYIANYPTGIYGDFIDVFSYIQAPIEKYLDNPAKLPQEDKQLFWSTYGQIIDKTIMDFTDFQSAEKFSPAARAALSARFEFGESG